MKNIKVEYTVDTGVPIPVTRNSPILIKHLNVGESVLFPVERRSSLQTAASKAKREAGMEYTIKKVSDTDCRIWRVK